MANGNGYSAGNLIIEIQTMSKETNAGLSAMNKNLKTSAFSITNLVNKVYFLRNYTKSMFGSVKTMLNLAVDYTETLNLWQVAMRGNTAEAENFVKTMNKAYGIATQTLMEYQAIFKNMLSSLGGISGDVSYQLSEYLTQMAIDYASLYNTSIERAMTTFQSVLSGQVRPIRSIAGYDITETTIYQLYQQLGGTKTMRQLSQTEKRLLRIYAVFQQMESSGAVGDLAKTMESTANQMRIMKEATKELMTWLGMLMEDVVRPMLPYINAAIITMTNIIKAFAQLRDIKPQEFGAVESVQELNEELDQTQGKLLSFDRFEALNSGEDNSNILGIDENLLAGLSQYSSILDGVSGKAQELAEQWSKIFIEYDAEGNVVGLTEKTIGLGNALKGVFVTLGLIVAFNLGAKILSLIGSVSNMTGLLGYLKLSILEVATTTKGLTTNTTLLGKALSFILNHPVILAIGAIIAVLVYLYNTNEDVRNSINSIFKTLQPLLSLLGGLLSDLLKPIKDLISSLMPILGRLVTLIADGISRSLATAMLVLVPFVALLEYAVKAIQSLVQGLSDLFSGNWSSFWGNQKKIWSNWVTADFAKSAWGGVKSSYGSFMGQTFRSGGQVEDGIFTMNKGEIIGNFDDGSTVVANNQQIISGIQQGVYSAVVSAMRQSGSGGVGDVYLDGRKVGQTTARSSHREMSRIGLVKATR